MKTKLPLITILLSCILGLSAESIKVLAADKPNIVLIFRKRRHLLDLLFRTSIECLRDWFRARLDLPDGQLAAVAAVQTFAHRILVLGGDPIPPDEFFWS